MMRRLLSIAALTLIAAGPASSLAHAQFNGPSPGISDTINRTVQITTDRSILFPPQRDLLLAPGDIINVTLYGADDYTSKDKVGLDGYLRLPLILPVQVQGLTMHEAEHLIASQLEATGMYTHPQVLISLADGPAQIATITGLMHQVVPILAPRRLHDILAAGGGLPANGSHVLTLQRPGVAQPIVIDLGVDPEHSEMSNVPIFAGDTIVISSVGSVYLLGALKSPAVIPLPNNSVLTVLKAYSRANGSTFEAQLDDAKIIRTNGTERIMIPVRIKRIMKGKDPDPVLQADDILLVPSSLLRAAIKSGGIGTALGIISALVYIEAVH